jgi:N-acyl-D-aspartate/D-glutamate deacylase
MVDALGRAMDEGAFGLSSGLEYPLGAAATTDELVALATETGRRGGLYAIHTRDRDFRSVEAFDEAFAVAEQSGAPFQISHLAPRVGAPAGALEGALARIDRARASGLDIACDQHTRLHGITKLTTMLPPSASAAGTDELLRQLRDPAARERFHAFREPIHKLGLMGHWDRLWLFEHSRAPEWVGSDFAAIAAERGQHPFDAILDLLLEAGDDAPNVLFIGLVQTQQDLDTTFAAPFCSPESDATTLAADGPLAGQRFLGAYTWAANYLRTAVRERGVVTLEAAIQRMTALPARRAGLHGRGTLTKGAAADIAIFDPATIADTGTVTEPNAYATGIRAVIVNGAIAVDDGAFAERRTGHVLRRSNGGTR